MSKIITVIQLLNRTANGEEIPKTVKCNGKKYNYHDYSKNYYYINDKEECLFDDDIAFHANNEVEILEDNTEEIEELKIDENGHIKTNNGAWKGRKLDVAFADKINELVKTVNSIRKGLKNESND